LQVKNRPKDVSRCGPSCPPHHWKLDASGRHGYCMKPGCTMTRDFEASDGKRNPTAIYFIPDKMPTGYVPELSLGGGHE
jgi:hypothetical protein